MANNFYQINNEILKLDPYGSKGDLEKIQFNHYLCRKENLQRTKEDLDRGLFKLSYTAAIADTGLSRRKVQRFIQWFIDKGIIECIKKSQVKGEESIFAYTSVYYLENEKSDTNCDTNSDTNSDTNLSSIFNTLRCASDTNSDTDCDTNSDTSKKEKEKENIKIVSIDNKLSSTSTKNKYTEKVKVKVRYKGLYRECNRFNGEPPKYEGNEYIYHNGYIYEIHKDIVRDVNRYWTNNPPCLMREHGSDIDVYENKLPFEEINIIKDKVTNIPGVMPGVEMLY